MSVPTGIVLALVSAGAVTSQALATRINTGNMEGVVETHQQTVETEIQG